MEALKLDFKLFALILFQTETEMAEGGAPIDNPDEDPSRVKSAHAIQELFHGRFSEDDAFVLLRHHAWDKFKTSQFILTGPPDEIRGVLGDNATDVLVGVREDEVLMGLASRHSIQDETRQFACGDCDHVWWKRVPARKPVSKCFKCHRKFDPVPRNREWGNAQYQCACGNEFTGFGVMDGEAPCYECGGLCKPIKIVPSRKRANRQRRSGDSHSCTGQNCYHKAQGGGVYVGLQGVNNTQQVNRQPNPPNARGRNPNRPTGCSHPKSTDKRVMFGSSLHVSTGSTVDTFLSQDDLQTTYEPSLYSIDEQYDD